MDYIIDNAKLSVKIGRKATDLTPPLLRNRPPSHQNITQMFGVLEGLVSSSLPSKNNELILSSIT